MVFFFFNLNTLSISFHSLLACWFLRRSWIEIFSSFCRCFSLLASNRMFFIFDFLWFEDVMPKHSFVLFFFLACALLDVLWDSWICGFVSDVNLKKFSGIIISKISSVISAFFTCWYAHCVSAASLVIVGQSLDSLLFCFRFYFLCFLIFKVSVEMSPSLESLSLTVSILLISPSKASFISVTVGFFFPLSRILCCFFMEFLSLCSPHVARPVSCAVDFIHARP